MLLQIACFPGIMTALHVTLTTQLYWPVHLPWTLHLGRTTSLEKSPSSTKSHYHLSLNIPSPRAVNTHILIHLASRHGWPATEYLLANPSLNSFSASASNFTTPQISKWNLQHNDLSSCQWMTCHHATEIVGVPSECLSAIWRVLPLSSLTFLGKLPVSFHKEWGCL